MSSNKQLNGYMDSRVSPSNSHSGGGNQKPDVHWEMTLKGVNDLPRFPAVPKILHQPLPVQVVEQKLDVSANLESISDFTPVLWAAWSILAARLADSDDVLFASKDVDIGSQHDPETLLPVRIHVDKEQPLACFIVDIQKLWVQILPHTCAPNSVNGIDFSDRIQGISTVLLTTNDAASSLHLLAETTFPLVLVFSLARKHLELRVSYDTAVLELAQLQRLLAQLEKVLQQVYAACSSTLEIGEVQCVSNEEVQQIWQWNAMVPEPERRCVHDLISVQVKRNPDALAFCSSDDQLTYAELDTMSSKLASYLVKLGIKSGTFVPLCFEKSIWTPVVMVAVMRTGAAFIALETNTPTARLQDIVTQVGASLILCSAASSDLASMLAEQVLVVDRANIEKLSLDSGKLPTVCPSSLLYIVFTSGSTGSPKGVMITHTNFSSAVKHQAKTLGLCTTSRILDFASYSFDAAIGNSLMTLATGGCVCVPSDDEKMNRLEEVIRRLRVNVLDLTPSVARLITPAAVPGVTLLTLGGEQMTRHDAIRWPACVRVINAYGPAECSITCVANDKSSNTESFGGEIEASGSVAIGKGLGSVTWIVEPSNHELLAPIGAVGELVIEGSLVGSGYLKDLEKSSATFIDAPSWLSNKRHGRLYKTGDLVRYQENGAIHYIGRKDTQVKFNGQRLELSEVEYHIRQNLSCDVDFVVETVKPGGGALALVVFIKSSAREVHHMIRGLDDELKKTLPAYMVPSAYIPIEYIPTTVSGKINRQLLKEIGIHHSREQLMLDSSPKNAEQSNQRPKSPAQLHLQKLWAQILDISPSAITLSSNFFRLGGDSIAAMRLVAIARYENLQLNVAFIFKHPRLEEMALGNEVPTIHTDLKPIAPFILLVPNTVITMREHVASLCGIETSSIEDIYPTTPLQEGLIALTAKNAAAFVGRNTIKLPQHVNLERFKSAWEMVVSSNSILRTRIVQTDIQGSVQVVLKFEGSIRWLISDSLSEYIEQDTDLPMSLGTEMARWAVIAEKGGAPTLVWTIHHALYDGWTFPIIANQLHRSYHGLSLQPEVKFNRFIQYTSKQEQSESQEFWQTYLDGARLSSSFPELPTPSYRPSAKASAKCQVRIFSSNQCGVTFSCIARAAWSILMGTLANTDSVTFGATLIGRNVPIPGVEVMTGPTITTVPMHVRFSREQEVQDLLTAIQSQSVSMMSHEHFGLQNIRRLSEDSGAACNFQTLLVIQPPDHHVTELLSDEADKQDKLFDSLDALDAGGKLDAFNVYALMLVLDYNANNVDIQANFDETVLTQNHIDCLLGQFKHVMQRLCGDPGTLPRCVGDIGCISESDLRTIWQWNGTVPLASRACVHDLISMRARLQPSAPAVCAWDGEFTYKQVDDLSTQIGYKLCKLGMGPQSLVPLCFQKSKWMAIAMIGVMKSGAGFVPMDADQPDERLRAITLQAKANLMLTSTDQLQRGQILEITSLVINDSFFTGNENEDVIDDFDSKLPHSSNPSATAFVVFTSGSTGIPKGIIISHENFCSSSETHAGALQFNADSRVFDFASYSFDVAMDNVLSTLMVGGCLCVPHSIERIDGIEGAMERMSVNLAALTPSVAKLIDPAAVPSLKVIALGGEAVDKEVVTKWSSTGVCLINVYGPAECQTCTVEPQILDGMIPSSIGRGYGCVTWIVDPTDHNCLLPLGAIGELLIEGPLVSVGYLQDPERTQNSFINGPKWLENGLHDQPGRHARLYKTGDLVRYELNGRGTIEYIGRKDSQVKISGQRVDLQEVNFHLKQAITDIDAEVTAELLENDGYQVLIGCTYLSSQEVSNEDKMHDRDSPDSYSRIKAMISGLRAKLQDLIPSYMIPTAFVNIDKIPLTVTGKTDHKLLREAALARQKNWIFWKEVDNMAQRETSTDMEQDLKSLWARVLGIDIDSVSATDDFFSHGGDSIRAMRLAGILRARGFTFGVMDIFDNPRLEKMSKILESREKSPLIVAEEITAAPFSLLGVGVNHMDLRERAAALCGVSAVMIEDMYPSTQMQENLMALTQKRPTSYIHRSIIELSAHTDEKRLRKAWEDVFRSHSILRTRIIYLEPVGSVQVVLKEDLNWVSSKSLPGYLAQDEVASMTLGTTLTRWAVIHTNSKPPCLVWTIHHALYDYMTLSQILSEVRTVYSDRRPIQSPHVGFNVFVKHILAQDTAESWKYWRSKLSGMQNSSVYPALPEPNYVPRPNTLAEHRLAVDLKSKVLSEVTLSSIIRAAWSVLAARLVDSDDILFGTTLFGRNAPLKNIENVMGPTIITIPVRKTINWTQSTVDFVKSIQEDSVQSMPFEHVNLQHLGRSDPRLKAALRFQTLLVVQPRLDARPSQREMLPSEDIFRDFDASGSFHDFNEYLLMLVFSEIEDGLFLQVSYDETVLAPIEIERLVGRLHGILLQLYSSTLPRVVQDIECISQEELGQIRSWNRAVPESVELSVVEMVMTQIKEQPNAVAIHSSDGDLTFKGLDELSSTFAKALSGLATGQLVALCFEKSMWTSVALLAVLKAGRAFLLLNPQIPVSRLKSMVSQSKARMVLSSESQYDLASQLTSNVIIICRKTAQQWEKDCNAPKFSHGNYYERLTSEKQDRPHHKRFTDGHISSDRTSLSINPAMSRNDKPAIYDDAPIPPSTLYVVFTSGSTGRPKGVITTHANFATAAKHQATAIGYNSKARVFDFASYSYDVSIMNLLYSMISGACLCVPSEAECKGDIARAMSSLGVTLAFLTPSVARLVEPHSVPTLDTLLLGGEPVTSMDVEKWAKMVRVANVYGPAECTGASTANQWMDTPEKAANIGHGLGTLTWVVNSHDNLAPIGAVGELVIEGPSVSPGYLGEEVAKASAFVTDPPWLFDANFELGARRLRRLYKTGDLVRYDIDGSLIYIGRKDTQTKIRGQRVELGDVEHHLHRALQQIGSSPTEVIAEVILHEGLQKLVAFIRMSSLNEDEIDFRAHEVPLVQEVDETSGNLIEVIAKVDSNLREKLPDYMVPSAYIPLNYVPTNASDKADRKSLKTVGSSLSKRQLIHPSDSEDIAENVEPSTHLEYKLRILWARVLSIDETSIGAGHNFFKVGGDSIIAMRLIALARGEGLSLKMTDIFAKPRLLAMAEVIVESTPNQTPIDNYSIMHLATSKDIDLLRKEAAATCGVEYDSIEDIYPCTPMQEGLLALTAKTATAYISRDAFHISEALDLARFKVALEKIVSLNQILRSRIISTEKHGFVQVVLSTPINWEYYSDSSQKKQITMTLGDPLVRWAFVSGGNKTHRLIWTIHHALYDAWSTSIITRQIQQAYQEEEITKTVDFNLFVKYLTEQNSNRATSYWQSQLDGFTMTSNDLIQIPGTY